MTSAEGLSSSRQRRPQPRRAATKPPTPKNTTPTTPTSRTGHGDSPGSSANAPANTTKPSARQRQAGGRPEHDRHPQAGVGNHDAAFVAVAHPQSLQAQPATPPPGSKQRRHQQTREEEQGDAGAGAALGTPTGQRHHQPPHTQQPPDDDHERDLSPAAGEPSGPPLRQLEGRRGRRWLGRRSRAAGRRHHQQQQRQRADGRDDHPGDSGASCQHHHQQHGNQGGHGQADPVAQPPGPYEGGGGGHQHQGGPHLRGVKVPLIGLDQYQQQPEQPEQHGGHPHHTRTRPPAPGQHRRPRGSLGHDQLPSIAAGTAAALAGLLGPSFPRKPRRTPPCRPGARGHGHAPWGGHPMEWPAVLRASTDQQAGAVPELCQKLRYTQPHVALIPQPSIASLTCAVMWVREVLRRVVNHPRIDGKDEVSSRSDIPRRLRRTLARRQQWRSDANRIAATP